MKKDKTVFLHRYIEVLEARVKKLEGALKLSQTGFNNCNKYATLAHIEYIQEQIKEALEDEK